jgi:hypothetical protein
MIKMFACSWEDSKKVTLEGIEMGFFSMNFRFNLARESIGCHSNQFPA